MEKRRTQKGEGILIIILVLLVLTIAGLSVAIILNLNKNENSTLGWRSDVDVELPEELMGDDLSPTDQVTKEASIMFQNPDYSNEDIEAYYDQVVGQALNEGNTDFAIRIMIQKMNFMTTTAHDCFGAKNYVNSIDLSPYSGEEKAYFASYVVSMAKSCKDGNLADEWNKIYDQAGGV